MGRRAPLAVARFARDRGQRVRYATSESPDSWGSLVRLQPEGTEKFHLSQRLDLSPGLGIV
jgi:hypothetical protein